MEANNLGTFLSPIFPRLIVVKSLKTKNEEEN